MEKKPRQRIRYLRTRDGVQLAWAEAGQGPALVKAANWLCHLEYEWESPVWGHWVRFFSERFRFVRYDERGCGLTDWKVDDLSCDRWVEDLEEVVDASGVDEPFALIGVSQGCAVCISYAVRHPERVSKMVLYGGYDRGFARRNDSAAEREYRAIVELCRSGWGKDNPAFRQIFTSRFVPGATEAQLGWFNELCRRTSAPEIAARLLEARANVEVSELVPQVKTPTLVIHANEDQVVSVRQGRRLATRIPGAQYVELDSKNHVLLEHEPAWERFKEAVSDFLGVAAPAPRGVFDQLSAREREILSLIARGLANAEIAERLSISDKTVRNHVSNIFDKLGLGTRAQAIVFARDHGFQA
jgi:pimeloyl-ACP methyl ester carboxylesterase/DNA-binding CsgD family transcriptional regulator